VLAAQARVDAQSGTAQAATSGFGGTVSGSAQSGRAAAVPGAKSIYFGQ
jgi:hypothetical protein